MASIQATFRYLFVFVLLLLPLSSCKHTQDSSVASTPTKIESDKALAILGIQRPGVTTPQVCGGSCHMASWHSPDKVYVTTLAAQTRKIKSCMDTEEQNSQAWINCLKGANGDWSNELGIFRAGLHTPAFEEKFKTMMGPDYKASYDDLVAKRIMPPDSNKPNASKRLTAEDYATVLNWFQADMPGLSEAFPAVSTTQTCKEDLSSADLKTYLQSKKWSNWEMINSEKGIAMFGCKPIKAEDYEPYRTALEDCFTQKVDGKPVYPLAETLEFAKSWSNSGSTDTLGLPIQQKMRILKSLTWAHETNINVQSTYWMRSSADGRFVGNGLRAGSEFDKVTYAGYVVDLQQDKISLVSANYDPGFFPNNKGFSFMQTDAEARTEKAWFCNQSLLTQGKSRINFSDYPDLCYADSMGVYQHLSVDPEGNDHIVVRSDNYANDSGGIRVFQDPPASPFAKDTPELEVHVLRESAQTYSKPNAIIRKTLPFEGDFSISPNSKVLLSRFASSDGLDASTRVQLGYKLRKISVLSNPEGKSVELKDLGTICLKGGKATMSFNERFFAVHHYSPDADINPTEANRFKKSLSNVMITDLWSGKSYQITNMKKGQYALYAHFRSDGWLYMLIRDVNEQRDHIVASDVALRIGALDPIPDL